MAIRPTDLQNALIVSTFAPPVNQRAEQAGSIAQGAAQAEFVAKTDERQEKVAETTELKGNKIAVKDKPDQEQGGAKGQKRERRPGDPYEEVVDEAAGLSDGTPHLIDYTA